jgi:hypothetical protein
VAAERFLVDAERFLVAAERFLVAAERFLAPPDINELKKSSIYIMT